MSHNKKNCSKKGQKPAKNGHFCRLANGKQEGTEEDMTLLHFSTSELQKNFKAENGAAKKFHNPEIKYKGGW